MEVVIKKLPKSKVELHVSLPWDEWKGEIAHALEHLAKETKVPGFRPGKAPLAVLEKHLGKETILNEAAEHAVSHSYVQALKQEKLEAIGAPEVRVEKIAENETLAYSAVTAVMPEVKLQSWRGDVNKINAEFTQTGDAVTEEEVAKELQKLAETRAKLVTVHREARTGDNVLVNFSVSQNGVSIENGTSEKHPVVLGRGAFIPGFEDNLLGMRADEEKTFELTFPEGYHAKNLAGRPATFQVKLNVVQERELPALDDVFAKGLGHFESLEKLKESLRGGMLKEKKVKNEERHRGKILEALVEKAEIEYPQILVEEELARTLRVLEMQAESQGFNFAEYLAQMKKTEADLKKEWEPIAKKTLAANLILDYLAKENEIDADSKEIEAEMNKTLAHYKNIREVEKKIDMERLYNAAREHLLHEKTFAWLKSLK